MSEDALTEHGVCYIEEEVKLDLLGAERKPLSSVRGNPEASPASRSHSCREWISTQPKETSLSSIE